GERKESHPRAWDVLTSIRRSGYSGNFDPELVRWLSGRKQRFAKAPYPKRVPRVRIPPSPRPSLIRQIADPHRTARSREPEIRTPFDCPCLQSARVKATSIS